MRMGRRIFIVNALLLASLGMTESSLFAQTNSKSTTPVPRDGGWMQRHNEINKRTQEGDIDLIFIGDSITQGWNDNEIWKKYYGNRKAANLGISGDRTEHVLWRLDHGNIDGISPKVAVLMIGTNNSGGKEYSAEDIGEGIRAIVAKLRDKLPKTKVLILAIFPRGEKPNPPREKNAKASKIAAELADNKDVFFLDIGPAYLNEKGEIDRAIMPDFLHLSPEGYKIWAKSIEPKLSELLGDKAITE